MKERLIRYYVFFKQGHGGYLVYFMALFNFVTIQYALLIEKIPVLETFFPRFYVFASVFVVVYPIIAISIGWLDFKRGTVPTTSVLQATVSPFTQATIKAWIKHFEGEDDEAIEHLRKFLTTK